MIVGRCSGDELLVRARSVGGGVPLEEHGRAHECGEARAPVPLQELAVDLAVFFLCVVVVVEMRN